MKLFKKGWKMQTSAMCWILIFLNKALQLFFVASCLIQILIVKDKYALSFLLVMVKKL